MKEFKKTESVEEFLARGGQVKKLELKDTALQLNNDGTSWIRAVTRTEKSLQKKDFKWSEGKENKIVKKKHPLYCEPENEA